VEHPVDHRTPHVDAEDGEHEQAAAVGQVDHVVGPGRRHVGDVDEREGRDRHG
jgi:hypothetical protein